MLKSAANPEGLQMEVFDSMRSSMTKDRSQFYKDLATQFYGANRPGAKVSQGLLDQFWLHARRGRPDRSCQGLGGENSQTYQGREGNLLSGCTARPHSHASGSGQRRPAGLPEVLD